MSATPALANDKYRATTRATWIASPADSAIPVTAIPANLPTIVTVGWNTQYETEFRVEGVSGTNSSNYALTSVTKIKGYTGNLPEGLAVNCLNNEEYFNQWGDQIAGVQASADAAAASAALAEPAVLTANAIASSATPTPVIATQRNIYAITALTAAAAIGIPAGATPQSGWTLVLRIKDNGTAHALTWDSIFRAIGVALPSTTVLGKILYVGCIYNFTDSKWDVLVVQYET